ncbi:hypothetical protein CCO03_09065 [Comamonas serinivorans]|uniref:Uncharacterized protein n=1 Tax=Comamonas serinivorans TaxID=1082851 RepID=A0A1Y0ENC1_9BURK|nr:DUF58 domain-containing protein [Comamonas serinivorans]ARU04809.1 hypothetical protein CCO03_09065 [Comamonas serinivorans]
MTDRLARLPGVQGLRARRSALRLRLRRWWQQRQTATDHLDLTQRNVYVLPTRAGLMLCVTLVALLIGSINYQLNLGYLLTFLLAGCTAMALFVSHGNLRGLGVTLRQVDEVYAGSASTVHIELTNTAKRPRFSVALHTYGSPQAHVVDVDAQAIHSVSLAVPWPARGEHALPLIVLESRFPMGAFRVWTVWRPRTSQLVYPRPEPQAPALPLGEARAGQGGTSTAQDWSEFDGVRPYRSGDPLKALLWKKFAKSNELVSRDGQASRQRQLWLDWARCGNLDPEARLSRLTAWTLQADKLGLPYGLRLPGRELQPGQGAAHRVACLKALALW